MTLLKLKIYNIQKVLDISNIKRIEYRNDLNVLRALAVSGVVLYHSEVKLFQGGWLGVDVFFVISGFLISNIIISELNTSSFTFFNFYVRRVRRILPALISTLILTIPISIFLLTPKAMLEYSKSLIASIFFFSNYYFQNLDFYNAEPTKYMPLLHTWSLSIEEQFYIFFPLICFILYKVNKKNIFIFLFIFFSVSIFLNSTTSELVKFYQVQFRLWELLLGSLIMIINQKLLLRHLEKIGTILIFISFIYFDDSVLSINSLEPKLLATLGTALVLLSNPKNSNLFNILNKKIVSIIGLSSYSIYLFHQPIFAFIRISQERFLIKDTFLLRIIILAILIFTSYFNWRYVEVFFQKITDQFFLFSLLISIAIILIFVFWSIRSDGFSSRYDYVPEEVLEYSKNPNIYPETYSSKDYFFMNSECTNQLISSYCIWFNEKSSKNIYLIGDSQTNSLSVALLNDMKGFENQYNLVFLRGTLGRCLLSKQSDTVGEVKECSDQNFNNFLQLLNSQDDIVIIFGRFDTWISNKGLNEIKCIECNYLDVFNYRVEQLSLNSKKLYIIEPIPTFEINVSNAYLYKQVEWGTPITIDRIDWENYIYKTNNFLKRITSSKTEFISTIDIFCDTKCYASTNNELYYSDSNHLTLKGAQLLAYEVKKELIKFLNNETK